MAKTRFGEGGWYGERGLAKGTYTSTLWLHRHTINKNARDGRHACWCMRGPMQDGRMRMAEPKGTVWYMPRHAGVRLLAGEDVDWRSVSSPSFLVANCGLSKQMARPNLVGRGHVEHREHEPVRVKRPIAGPYGWLD